ncbi:cytochrome c oxidase assembly protein [Corynebacterium tapiri]|uniref:Copper resistance protein n=1 Tax=Corynebacterium tapiri TaxID=1448266 RepID=A0A5C4U310_9CORY|nr:cytochrome c oxidase assembly protein [Corynebacterium tapiri]TNL94869.1 copper resistance protein [Corynebacterium tapiri]
MSSTRRGEHNSEAKRTWPIYLLAALIEGIVGGAIGYSFLGGSLAALGIPDPGPVTSFGLPFLRAVSWIMAALATGSFMFSAFYIPPQKVNVGAESPLKGTRLSVDGHIASRTGANAALVFALIGLVMVPMTLSDISGTPFLQTLNPASFSTALQQVAASEVWLLSAIIAGLVSLVARLSNRWAWQPVLMLGSIGMIIPLAMEGHNATGGAHDYGTNSYLWHLILMVVWIGGLLALLAHGRRLGPSLETAVRRYSVVALFALLAVALSGVVAALIRVQLGDLLTTKYGLVITGKIVGTIILAVMGFAHRQLTIPQLGSNPRSFLRLALAEILLMAAVAGLAVTMGRTPPPPPLNPNLSPMAIQIGYELTKEPTFFSVFTVWRFDILFGALGVIFAVLYLLGVRRVRARGGEWKTSYTAWWLAGCVTLVITMSSGIGMYMPATYSMHMVAHMMLSMVVPLIMALGAPLTLITSAFSPEEGPHQWVKAFTHSRFLAVVTTPWVNLLQFLVFFYLLYLSFPLYELAISEHAGHITMNVLFLVSGYFYFWELVGPDEIPGRRSAAIRLFWLVVSMPVHLYFGVYLMQLNTVMGEEFYRSLQLPWNPDLLKDQKNGGGIAWAFGSFPLTFVLLWLMLEWRRDDKAAEERIDARLDSASRAHSDSSAEQGEDEPIDELAAYNAMLQRYHRGGGDTASDYYSREF